MERGRLARGKWKMMRLILTCKANNQSSIGDVDFSRFSCRWFAWVVAVDVTLSPHEKRHAIPVSFPGNSTSELSGSLNRSPERRPQMLWYLILYWIELWRAEGSNCFPPFWCYNPYYHKVIVSIYSNRQNPLNNLFMFTKALKQIHVVFELLRCGQFIYLWVNPFEITRK